VPEIVAVDNAYFLGNKTEKEVKVEKRDGVTSSILLENEEEQRRKKIVKYYNDESMLTLSC
jgi:hypothetical protein